MVGLDVCREAAAGIRANRPPRRASSIQHVMQQKHAAVYLLLLLLIDTSRSSVFGVNGQTGDGSSAAPSTGSNSGVTGMDPLTSTGAVGSPTDGLTSSPVAPSSTNGSTGSVDTNGLGSPAAPPGVTAPSGSTASPPSSTGSTTPPDSATTSSGSANADSTGSGTSPPITSPAPAADVGWVLPVPDETAVDVGSRDECTLTSALFGAMGAKVDACGSSDSRTQSLSEFRSTADSSSSSIRGGLVTTKAGAQFCVSHEGADRIAAESTQLSFSSTGSIQRELPDIHDPACDDPDAELREGCSEPPVSATFFEDVTSSSTNTDEGSAAVVVPSPSPSPPLKPDLSNCTTKFLRMGSKPRSVAIVLLKWPRNYYKTKEQCCEEQGNPPDCDCKWSGYTYDLLPTPKMFSRLFTDECDQGPSVNRGYYDLSGARVTFHSKLRVPIPQGTLADRTPDADGPAEAATPADVAQPAPSPPVPLEAVPVPMAPVETGTSYLDPDGVDVYGWATLGDMRTPEGSCRDWCGEAITQLNVNASEYNHVMCFQLLASKALCDVCESDCIGTCPASTGITGGCGCATCYYAWGGQSSCNRPAKPGVRVGMAASTRTYAEEMIGNAGGPFISVTEGMKLFIAHEIGHNMGLTHTSSINCRVEGETNILREPRFCTPDWYGDYTSFMGRSASMSLPNALRYKVRWLPRATLRTHPQGEERQYVLRASTSRRPSWQRGTRLRWFSKADTLTVRVQLRNPPGSLQDVSSYSCPCTGRDNVCPDCAKTNRMACENGPCCTDPSCADDDLGWMYIELHQPFKNDYSSEHAGVAIRLMGNLSDCTSTRLLPLYASNGQPSYLLTQPDPSGVKAGSKFEDFFRNVRVVLESWTKSRAVIRVWSA